MKEALSQAEKLKALQDFRDTLVESDLKWWDEEVEEKGVDEVYAHLDFHRNQRDYAYSLFE